jgi:regulator of extracellular matrix RemA (YlzA/DUF370 family)
MFINAGFNNLVSIDNIVAVLTPNSAPTQRLIKAAIEAGGLLDATLGRKTRGAIVLDTNQVILTACTPDTIASRVHRVLGVAVENEVESDAELEDETEAEAEVQPETEAEAEVQPETEAEAEVQSELFIG